MEESHLPPTAVTHSQYDGQTTDFQTKDFYATIPTDTFQKVIKKECMYRAANIKLLLTWKPRGVLSAQSRIGQAKAAFANCATTANIIPGHKSFKEAVMKSTYTFYPISPEDYPSIGQESGPRNVPTYESSHQHVHDGGWQEVPTRRSPGKRVRNTGTTDRDYRHITSRPISPDPQGQGPMTQ